MPRRGLFIDLDGVLADFDTAYKALFGEPPDRSKPTPEWFWPQIRTADRFFENLQPMPDAMELWNDLKQFNPTILSGIPTQAELPDAGEQKMRWVHKHISDDVRMVFCRSKEKRLHGNPGDVLVDDWTKYRKLWIKMGGIFILHTDAESSIRAVREVFDTRGQ